MPINPDECGTDCGEGQSARALNRACPCTAVDIAQARASIEAVLQRTDILDPVVHANLFSPYALFVERASLEAMRAVAAALFRVAALPAYVKTVMAWAPEIARQDPGSPGGVIGLDFHLTEDGPRLIEINTNPGGLLLNATLLDATASCAPERWITWIDSEQAVSASIEAWLLDARRQSGAQPARMAIVDTEPARQFLAPEFALYARAFRAQGIACAVRAPDELAWDGRRLRDADGELDFVYNRLTDFTLAAPDSAALAAAYRARAVAVAPHPHAHARLADKRALAVLCDAHALSELGATADDAQTLLAAIPRTVVIDPPSRDALWAERDRYFFKPAGGYGSKGSYRGDKLTRRVWESIGESAYVAQALVPPSLRVIAGGDMLKVDIRCYATDAGTILFAARLYQGQTTNMRTPSGGFAPVLTTRE